MFRGVAVNIMETSYMIKYNIVWMKLYRKGTMKFVIGATVKDRRDGNFISCFVVKENIK